jgi:hypothetical protein
MSPSLPCRKAGVVAFDACGDLVQEAGRRKWGYTNWDLRFLWRIKGMGVAQLRRVWTVMRLPLNLGPVERSVQGTG